MYAALLAASLVAPAPPMPSNVDGVQLTDAIAFGVSPEAVRPLWLLSSRHCGLMREQVQAWNSPTVAGVWEQETTWRARCWFLLDDVVGCPHLTLEKKMQSLCELRKLLGDEDYYGGKMPDPMPSYRPWSDR